MVTATKAREPAREAGRASNERRSGRAIAPPRYGIGQVDALARVDANDSLPDAVQCLRFVPPSDVTAGATRRAAALGVRGPGGPLPHLERIQAAFGRYDVSGIVAHTDESARLGARAMRAEAFASGNHVAFARPPSLHTAAHEAAHVVQQRGTVQLAGGVGQSGDRYEQHADAVADQVVAGKSAEGLLARLAGPSHAGGGGEGLVQRKELDLDVLDITGDFVWRYIEQLIREYKVEEAIAILLEKACLFALDWGVRLLDAETYLTAINPYIEILRGIIDVINRIPEPIQVALTYGIGWAIFKLSDNHMGGAITEAHINKLLIGGGAVLGKLNAIVTFLYDLGKNPASAVYSGIWAAARQLGFTTARSFSELLYADVTTPVPARGAPAPAPLIDADVGWLWLHLDRPQIGSWRQRGVERGGLSIGARFGVKLLGNTMGAKRAVLQIPYAGDWEAPLTDISVLDTPLKLGNIFSVDKIAIWKARINQDGLQFLHLVIDNLDFGDGTVTADKIALTYRAESDDGSVLIHGAAKLDIFDHQIAGRIRLNLDEDGELMNGKVELECPESFEFFDERVMLSNPKMWAGWDTNGLAEIGIGGDLELKLAESLDFAATGATIHYTSDEGFVGEVGEVRLTIPVHAGGFVVFVIREGRIDSEGFHAGKLSVIYAYGEGALEDRDAVQDRPAELREAQLRELVPGFDAKWIKSTGLEMLVVDLSADDVEIGAEGLEIGELTKQVTKFRGHLFGLGAEFDAKAGSGKIIGGPLRYTINPTALKCDFPITPGVHANFGIRAEVGMETGFEAGLTRKPPLPAKPKVTPWELEGKANFGADASLQLEAGLGLGIPMLASITGGLFARAKGGIAVEGKVTGTVLWDDDANSLSLSTEPSQLPSAELSGKVDLSAEVGAQVRAQVLYFIDKELWSYRFLEWKLGEWSLVGKLVAKPEGGYQLVTEKAGFGGAEGKPKLGPVFGKNRATAREVIDAYEKHQTKVTDRFELWRLVHDIQDPAAQLSRAEKRQYFSVLKTLNGTREDLDAMAMDVLATYRDRSSDESLLMSTAEWVKYSTTRKLLEDAPTPRDSVEPIDAAITAYHRASTLEGRKRILTDLIDDKIPTYSRQLTLLHSRKDMVDKLLVDAKLELARITVG